MRRTKLERAEVLEVKIKEMENEKKLLLQGHKEDERKNRTRRLCKHAGVLESVVPETASMNDEQLKWLFEQTLTTDFAKIRIGWARNRKPPQSVQNQTPVTVQEPQNHEKSSMPNASTINQTNKNDSTASGSTAVADIA